MFYEVGGSVRDSLMGRKPSDTDMTAVIEASDWERHSVDPKSVHPFALLILELKLRGFNVVQEKREFLTAKALGPPLFEFAGRLISGPIDFVLSRKEGPSRNGRHPDWVDPGSLQDDLRRRDFTVNAIARDSAGTIIDEHEGIKDIGNRTLKCVGDPNIRFHEDRLRVLRAMRFSVTHSLKLTDFTGAAIDGIMMEGGEPLRGVSDERVREELLKMFAADTERTIRVLTKYGMLPHLFKSTKKLWLKPTLEAK